jgi:hypothetical protein
VENFGVIERLQDRRLDDVWEERVLVWRFIATDEGLQGLFFAEEPVEEGETAVGDLDGAGRVNRAV